MKRVLFLVFIIYCTSINAQTIEKAKKLYENKQYKKAIGIFQKFSEDSESQYYLAKAYLNGDGIEKNVTKAFEYAKKSANQNNSSGLNLVGTMYQYGDGVKIDNLQALMYYKQASNLGNTKSMSNIGNMYRQGKIVKQDFKIAEEWFNKAITKDPSDSYAYANLGDLYRFNYKKYNKAIEYYENAIKTGVSKSEGFYHIARVYDENIKNYKSALLYYQGALENGNNKVNLNLGLLYHYKLKEKDYEKALEYYKKDIENGSNYSFYNMGLIYQSYKKEFNKAEEYYIKSIKSGYDNAYFQLADLYHYNIKNIDKAIDYYTKSIEKNDIRGYYRLGLIYQYTKKDYLKADLYYKKAIGEKDEQAYFQLGQLYHYNLKKYEEALELYNKSLEYKKSNYTYALLGDLYKFHFKKYDKSIENYFKAIEYGTPEKDGFFHIAKIYDENLNDYDKAIELYLKSKNLGNNVSNRRIGMIYHYKLNLYDKAKEYYKEAINKGDAGSNLQLATLYHLNLKDYTNAEKYYQKAIEHGDKYVYKNLAYLYRDMGKNQKSESFIKKAITFDKNINQCELVDFYRKINPLKAYELAINEISKKPEGKELQECYSFLGALFSNIHGSTESVFPIDYKKSIKYFELSEKYSSVKTDFYGWTIGDLYEEQGDNERAKEWYKKAYALNNDFKYINKIKDLKVDITTNSNLNIYPFLDYTIFQENLIKHFPYEESARYCFIPTTNKYIQMYDKKDERLKNEFRGYIGPGLIGHIRDIVVNEKKKIIYTTANGLNQINIFNLISAQLIDFIKLSNHKDSFTIEQLNLSEDGRVIVAYNDYEINIIDTKTKEQQLYKLKKYNNKTFLKDILISKIEDDYKINILTSDNYLHTFSYNKKRKTSKVLFTNQVKFKSRYNSNSKCIKLNEKKFDIKNISKLYQYDNLLYISMDKNKNYKFDMISLKLQNSSKLKTANVESSKIEVRVVQNGSIVEIYEDKNKLSEISLLEFGYSYSKVLNNEYILILTKKLAQQLIFDKHGKLLAKLKGDKVLQTNAYYNKGYLYTYGKDNLIHIFNVSDLRTLSKKDVEYVNQEKKRIIEEGLDDKFVLDSYDKLSPNYLGFIPTLKQVQNFALIEDGQKVVIKKPLVSLYIKNDKDWIIYTPEGLFTYGGDGHKLLKYHQNQGFYKEAKIIENEKLFDKFYRPDLIKKILAGEKIDIPIDVKAVIQNIKPPELKIISNKLLDNKKDIDLTYQICDAGNGIADPKLIINGQAINPPTSRGFSVKKIHSIDGKCKTYNSIHTLSPGKNTISVKAYDKDKNIANISEKLEITTNYKIDEKPNLYFLSIAVSDYEEDGLDLNYPVKDVETVKGKIQKQSKTIYENIFTYDLHDVKVTQKNIEKTFDEIAKKIKINDAFILYIAGHGITKDGLYQFIPYKSNESITIDDIKTNLSKIATTKSLVLLDTCQSGTAIESIDTEVTKNRLAHNSTINYIVASSSDQVALEGYKNHGVFTYSVLDAFDKNDKLKVWGLADHISEVVPKITQEKFQYQQVPQAKLNKNFILVGNDE